MTLTIDLADATQWAESPYQKLFQNYSALRNDARLHVRSHKSINTITYDDNHHISQVWGL